MVALTVCSVTDAGLDPYIRWPSKQSVLQGFPPKQKLICRISLNYTLLPCTMCSLYTKQSHFSLFFSSKAMLLNTFAGTYLVHKTESGIFQCFYISNEEVRISSSPWYWVTSVLVSGSRLPTMLCAALWSPRPLCRHLGHSNYSF